ncbi:MAG: GntR family transcriptional regulator, partial [Steroidobacteraceae bacterium]
MRTSVPKRSTGTAPIAVKRDRRPKLAEEVARRIEKDIIAGGWEEGRFIGSEADLVKRYGVSRWSIREAISILERDGLARMRRGGNGGLFVATPGADAAVEALRNYLEFSRVSVEDIIAARAPIEELVVVLAAKRIDTVAIAQLQRLASEVTSAPIEDIAPYGITMLKALREATRNVVLAVFSKTLGQLTMVFTMRSDISDERFQKFYYQLMRTRVAQVKAIAGKEIDAARRIEQEHIRVSRTMLTASIANLPKNRRTLAVGRKRVARWLATDATSPVSLKRSDLVAQQIHMGIVAAGWQPGAHLGLEPELQKRYGVSRAVFREAVRSLERLGAVEMRAGGGRGLKVGSPDPAATIRTAQIFLTHCGAKPEEVNEVSAALDRTAVLLAARRPPPERKAAAERLRAIAMSKSDATLSEEANRMGEFYLTLAEACGNPILELFMRVLQGMARLKAQQQLPARKIEQVLKQIRSIQV